MISFHQSTIARLGLSCVRPVFIQDGLADGDSGADAKINLVMVCRRATIDSVLFKAFLTVTSLNRERKIVHI